MLITFLKLTLLATTFNVAMTPLNSSVAKLGGYLAIILSLSMPFMCLHVPVRRKVRAGAVCLVFMAILVPCTYFIFPAKIDIDLLKAILSFFSCYAAIIFGRQEYRKKDLKQLFFITKLLSAVYIVYTYGPFDFRYTVINKWGDMQFTLGMGNPNATSMSIMFCVALLLMDAENTRRRNGKLIDYAMTAALVGTLIKLQSRTVVICCAVYIAVFVLKRIRIKPYMVYGALALAVGFLFIQIQLAGYKELKLMGKSLATGRDDMFAEYLALILANPMDFFLGNLFRYRLINYHNGPLSLIMNFGYIGYICYLVFWSTEMKTMIRQRTLTNTQRLAIALLLVYFVHSASEAGPTLGTIPYGTQMVIAARMAKDSFV